MRGPNRTIHAWRTTNFRSRQGTEVEFAGLFREMDHLVGVRTALESLSSSGLCRGSKTSSLAGFRSGEAGRGVVGRGAGLGGFLYGAGEGKEKKKRTEWGKHGRF
jgi:hypothetical protein